VRGTLLYNANQTEGIQIVDIGDPFNPVLVGSLPLEGDPADIDVVGDFAYLPAYNYGVKIVDIRNPAHPALRGSTSNSTGALTGIKVIGTRAYVAGLSGLMIFDVSNPDAPVTLGTFSSLVLDQTSFNLDVVGNLV